MKLRGNYSPNVTYNIGDVVKYTDDVVYHLQYPCPAGVPPVDTRFWSRCEQMVIQCALMIMDALEIESANNHPNLSEDALLLRSSTEGSSKSFIITVDDDAEITASELPTEGGN